MKKTILYYLDGSKGKIPVAIEFNGNIMHIRLEKSLVKEGNNVSKYVETDQFLSALYVNRDIKEFIKKNKNDENIEISYDRQGDYVGVFLNNNQVFEEYCGSINVDDDIYLRADDLLEIFESFDIENVFKYYSVRTKLIDENESTKSYDVNYKMLKKAEYQM